MTNFLEMAPLEGISQGPFRSWAPRRQKLHPPCPPLKPGPSPWTEIGPLSGLWACADSHCRAGSPELPTLLLGRSRWYLFRTYPNPEGSSCSDTWRTVVGEDSLSDYGRKDPQWLGLAGHVSATEFDPDSSLWELFWVLFSPLAMSDEDKERFFTSTKRSLDFRSPTPRWRAKVRSELCFQVIGNISF